jgi:hypothetical protein
MKYLIRAALTAISLATITPVANAATPDNAPVHVQDNDTSSWANG